MISGKTSLASGATRVQHEAWPNCVVFKFVPNPSAFFEQNKLLLREHVACKRDHLAAIEFDAAHDFFM
jgi:hypothetical protein